MALVFLIVGVLAVILGVRGQAAPAGQLLASEFTGPNSFVKWFLAIAILGAISAIKPARPFANAFIALVLVAMFLAKANPNAGSGGFFAQLQDAFTSATPSAKPSSPGSAAPAGGGVAAGPAAASAGPAAPSLPVIQLPVQGPQPSGDWLTGIENAAGIGPATSAGQAALAGLNTMRSFLQGLTSPPLLPGVVP